MKPQDKAILPNSNKSIAATSNGTSIVGKSAHSDFVAQLSKLEFETAQLNKEGRIIQRKTKHNKYFTEDLGNGVFIEMMYIPGGVYNMGSPEKEAARKRSEGPQHWAKVPDFFMGRNPITQNQWKAVAKFSKVNRELNSNPSKFKGGDRPVECISWEEANEFCRRLDKHAGRLYGYRIPTEAEWEYGCRAGTTTPFYFGETLTPEVANYQEKRRETTLVNHFKFANAWGLSDMHGNVFEWCLDNYIHYFGHEDAWLEGEFPIVSMNPHLIRGGSWANTHENCRSYSRFCEHRDSRYSNIGFRIVCAARKKNPGISRAYIPESMLKSPH